MRRQGRKDDDVNEQFQTDLPDQRFEDAMHKGRVDHVLRRVRDTLFPRQVAALLHDALELRDGCLPDLQAGHFDQSALEEAHDDFVARLLDLTARPPSCRSTGRGQALRTPIVNRKVFGGNRADNGSKAQEAVSSVLETCKNKTLDAFAFLGNAFRGAAGSFFA